MRYKRKQDRKLMDRIQSMYNVGEGDEHIAKHLSSLSGMKGAEKKLKDKIGKLLNKGEVVEKVMKRIEKRRGHYDS